MSRAPYRSSANDLGRVSQRWDAERFAYETDRNRGREQVDDTYEREERRVYDDRGRRETTISRERERIDISPPRAPFPPGRPTLVRRQSSLDTYDRRPLPPRYYQREEYGPPARLSDVRVNRYAPRPLSPRRVLPPARRYVERDYEDIKIAEPELYGDDEYRPYPERIREREIIRTRRSRSRESRAASHQSHSTRSTRSSSTSSASSSSRSTITIKSEYPKRGKTRMPARLVSKKAIIALGYPFEDEGEVIIIQKALGRENIDEVIRLSEEYKTGGAEVLEIEEKRVEVIKPPPFVRVEPPEVERKTTEVIEKTTVIERSRSPSPASSHRSHRTHRHRHSHSHSHHRHHSPVIVDARPSESTTIIRREKDVDIIEPEPAGQLVVLPVRDDRDIREELRVLEAERAALRSELRLERRGDRARRSRRASSGDLVLYEEVDIDGGVRIKRERKGPNPKLLRAMLATLT